MTFPCFVSTICTINYSSHSRNNNEICYHLYIVEFQSNCLSEVLRLFWELGGLLLLKLMFLFGKAYGPLKIGLCSHWNFPFRKSTKNRFRALAEIYGKNTVFFTVYLRYIYRIFYGKMSKKKPHNSKYISIAHSRPRMGRGGFQNLLLRKDIRINYNITIKSSSRYNWWSNIHSRIHDRIFLLFEK
jgi:hypothetical protein